MKHIFWVAAVLLALTLAALAISGSIEPLIRLVGFGQPAVAPIVRQRIPGADEPQPLDSNDQSTDSVPSQNAVTRVFFKSSGTSSSEAVRLEIKAVEQKSELVISGALRDGSACRRMQIDLKLKANDGREFFHSLMLGDTGQSGAQPIRSRRRLPSATNSQPAVWHAHVAALRCLDP